jgi:outer membrane protein, heavy metal efflux system
MYRVRRNKAIVLFIVASATAATAGAQPLELTERQAIERALSRPAVAVAEGSRVAAAQAAADEAGVWPNPELSLERERLGSGSGRSTETTLKIEQPIDLSGRRALRREAALQRVEATRMEQRERRFVLVNELRRSYAEALHGAELRAALTRWNARLQGTLELTRRQVEAGEASGYDRRRLERELQGARLRLQAAEADALRARETLGGWVEIPGEWRAVGSLLPESPPPLERYLAAVETRGDLGALSAQARASDRDFDAAQRAWIPDVNIGAGRKRVEETGHSDTGLLLSLSVPLPLFDRGRAAASQARSTAQALRAERELKLAQAVARTRGTWHQARALRDAAERFQREALSGSRELSTIAETAWRGGEATLLELLDAYRTELEAESSALDLALRARIARIEVDFLSGIE